MCSFLLKIWMGKIAYIDVYQCRWEEYFFLSDEMSLETKRIASDNFNLDSLYQYWKVFKASHADLLRSSGQSAMLHKSWLNVSA